MYRRLLPTLLLATAGFPAAAALQGLSPYLPLQLSPEIEWQVERLLVLADEPVLTRPIRAVTVMRALDKGCTPDPVLCQRVRRYLDRYMDGFAITHASAELALTKESEVVVANGRGASEDSNYNVSISGYWQPSPYFIANAGALAYEGDIQPEGSYVSAGIYAMRLDVGYRPHWLSPMQEGAMLWSTQAPTIPSVTLSNDVPLTSWGFNYEMFLGQLSHSDRIKWQDGYTSGKPSVIGMHLSLRPLEWFAFGVNRTMQFGGGARGGKSPSDVLKAFFDPSGEDNSIDGYLSQDDEFGNQIASFNARITLPEPLPMALYAEYAGEDTSELKFYKLGNAAFLVGVHLPRLPWNLDLRYEFNDWQNSWYVHHIYQDGFTNDDHVVGHWSGDLMGDGRGTGGSAHSLRVNHAAGDATLISIAVHSFQPDEYSRDFERGTALSLAVSQGLSWAMVGSEIRWGQDATGDDFGGLSAFVRW